MGRILGVGLQLSAVTAVVVHSSPIIAARRQLKQTLSPARCDDHASAAATPDVFSIINATGIGASAVVFGMFTYVACTLASSNPLLFLSTAGLVAGEAYAVAHPGFLEVQQPHVYHRKARPGQEVSDMPEETQRALIAEAELHPRQGHDWKAGHRHPHLGHDESPLPGIVDEEQDGRPLADPQTQRHLIVGHAAHIGGAITGVLLFFTGRVTQLVHMGLGRLVGLPPFGPQGPYSSSASSSAQRFPGGPLLRGSSLAPFVALMLIDSIVKAQRRAKGDQ